MSEYNTYLSKKMEQEKYEELQKQYDELRVQYKRQKQRIRKINRTKYNRQRERAANSDAVKEIRNKANSQFNFLNREITRQEQEIEELHTYQRYIESLSFAISGTIGVVFTFYYMELI